MSPSVLGISGVIVGFLASLAGVVLWGRFVALTRKYAQLEGQQKKQAASLSTLRKTNSELEKSIGKQRSFAEAMQENVDSLEKQKANEVKTLSEKLLESGRALQQTEEKAEHHRSQEMALLQQITTLDREKSELAKQFNALSSEVTRMKSRSDALQVQQSKTLELKKTQLEGKCTNLQKKYEESRSSERVTALELERYKRKAFQNAHLARLFRGQKELFEERNSNWERALSLLSTSILKEKGIDMENLNLGERVAKALEVSCQGELIPFDVVADEASFYEN